MKKKEFEAELLRRMNALRMEYKLTETGNIKVRLGDDKWTIKVLEPILGDERKCMVRLFHQKVRNNNNCVKAVSSLKFEKPCTTYYIIQYLIGHSPAVNVKTVYC